MGNGNRETESSIKGSQSIARASSSPTTGGNGWGRRGEGNIGAEAGWGRGTGTGSDMVDTVSDQLLYYKLYHQKKATRPIKLGYKGLYLSPAL